jgi:hypothetical protein
VQLYFKLRQNELLRYYCGKKRKEGFNTVVNIEPSIREALQCLELVKDQEGSAKHERQIHNF